MEAPEKSPQKILKEKTVVFSQVSIESTHQLTLNEKEKKPKQKKQNVTS